MSQHTRCATSGWRVAPPPRPPDGDTARRRAGSDLPPLPPSPGRVPAGITNAGLCAARAARGAMPPAGGRQAGTGSRMPRRRPASQTASRFLRFASAPSGDSPATIADVAGYGRTPASVPSDNGTGIDHDPDPARRVRGHAHREGERGAVRDRQNGLDRDRHPRHGPEYEEAVDEGSERGGDEAGQQREGPDIRESAGPGRDPSCRPITPGRARRLHPSCRSGGVRCLCA